MTPLTPEQTTAIADLTRRALEITEVIGRNTNVPEIIEHLRTIESYAKNKKSDSELLIDVGRLSSVLRVFQQSLHLANIVRQLSPMELVMWEMLGKLPDRFDVRTGEAHGPQD